jgi:L-asparaginase
MTQDRKAHVAVIGCGGTISTMAVHPLDFIEYLESGRKMEAGEVIERLAPLADFVNMEAVPFRAVSSSAIGPREWLELAKTIDILEREKPDLVGIVVLHGTATLEETAYFLNLALDCTLPVVIVGAQRPFNTTGSDAAINLIAAMRVAVDPQARGQGVLVVLNDEIHQAREVTKTSTYRLSAFRSPEAGPLGVVDSDRVVFHRRPVRPHTHDTPFQVTQCVDELPRVDISYAYAGADNTAVDAYVAAGTRGIVCAGFAPGMPTPQEREALERAAAGGVLVVQASRAGSGRVARRSYLARSGWIGAGDLNPQKARVLLMLALTQTSDPEIIQGFFDTL